ncbi:MAG: M48 family metalloprotease [Phycisphaerae bacterium]
MPRVRFYGTESSDYYDRRGRFRVPARARRRPRLRMPPRFIIGVVVALVSVVTYCSKSSVNPITGEKQRVSLTVDQEIALGLQSAPELAQQHGGLSPDDAAQARVDRVGEKLLARELRRKSPYEFEFHLLRDPKTVNAFALPGGQVFITEALYSRLRTEGQLAGVLGHEIGHVIERHSAQRIAKMELTQGLTGAAVLATYDPRNPVSRNSAAVAMVIGQLITMKYGRTDELESDEWGVKLTAEAGYDPRAVIEVMKILREASGGKGPPEFMSTHPDPKNRIQRIEAAIRKRFPDGVPAGLTP